MTPRTPGQAAYETFLNAHWDDDDRVWDEIAQAAADAAYPPSLILKNDGKLTEEQP